MQPNILDKYPVKSSSPCPSSNYVINAVSWEMRIRQQLLWAGSYEDCKDNAARYRFAENFLTKTLELDIKPKIVFHGKDVVKAEAARRSGNRLFAGGDLPGALAAYNESIIHAPFEDKGCIVLALGNRSAVFFRMERYAECIRDIDHAVLLGYPLESVKKLLMRKAKAFLAVGRPLAAISTLKKEGNFLGVCSGGTAEICRLDGDMKDYADLLALAVIKLQEEEEEEDTTSDDEGRCSPQPDLRLKYATGWNKTAERNTLKLRDGSDKMFSSLSARASFSRSRDSKKLAGMFVADQDLDTGDVLLMEPTFVSVVDRRAWRTNCIACLCWTDAPFPCSKCSVVVFCSPACANGPKAGLHAKECGFWQTVCLSDEEDRENHVRGRAQFHQIALLALRMMVTKSPGEWLSIANNNKLSKIPSEQPTMLGKRRYRQDDLMDVFWLTNVVEEERSPGVFKGKISLVVAFLAVYFVKVLETEYFSGIHLSKQARRRLGAIAMQALAVGDRECDFVKELALTEMTRDDWEALDDAVVSATALHPIHSQFAKSCDPNLIGVHYGDVLVVRARRPIRKGEALTTAYEIPNFAYLSREERQIMFRKHAYDKCKCRACEENWPLVDKLEREFLEGSCKVKCPFCSYVLGTFGSILEDRKRLRKGCPGCETDGRALYSAVTTVIDQFCLGKGSTMPEFRSDTLKGFFADIRAVRSICVEPSFVPICGDVLLERILMNAGNKRFDYLIPISDQASVGSGGCS